GVNGLTVEAIYAGSHAVSTLYTFNLNLASNEGGAATLLGRDGAGVLYMETEVVDLNTVLPGFADLVPPVEQLVFPQPPNGLTAGSQIGASVTVDIDDPNGNIITSDDTNVTLQIAAGPAGGALQGTTTVAAQNGVATFHVSLDTAGTYSLLATDAGDGQMISDKFTVTPSTAVGVAYAVAPQPLVSTGETIGPAVVVDVVDQFGNVVTSDNSAVTLAIQSGPAGGVLSGTTIETAQNGVATFSDLSVSAAGAYVLTASDGTLAAANASFTANPPENFDYYAASTVGSEFIDTAPVGALVMDSQGDLFGCDAGNGQYVYPTIFEIPAGASAVTQLVQLPGGEQPYTLAIDENGNIFGATSGGGTDNDGTLFEITAASIAAGNPSFLTLASMTVNNSQSPSGSIEFNPDSFGLHLVVDSHDDLFGTELGPNNETVLFELPAGSGTIESLATSDGSYGSVWLAVDAGGNLFGTTSNGNLALMGNPPAGQDSAQPSGDPLFVTTIGNLANTQTGSPSGGGSIFEITAASLAAGKPIVQSLVNFGSGQSPSNLLLDAQGNFYGAVGSTIFEVTASSVAAGLPQITTLVAGVSASGLARSTNGDIYGFEVGAYSNFFVLPAGTGTILSLAAYDLAPSTTANSLNVTSTGSSGQYVPDASVILDVADNIYAPAFYDGTKGPTDDGAIYKVASQPHLVFQPIPAGINAFSPLLAPIVVDVEDQFGNIETSFNSDVTLSQSSGPVNMGIDGTLTVAAVNGVATFNDLTFYAAGNYTLGAAAGLSSATSNTVAVASPDVHLVFTQEVADTTAGTTVIPTVSVEVEDASGNPFNIPGAAIAVATDPLQVFS
ncbi:MAG: choice-of-anchor tandem repeat GloVer-containing protein, partial [Tepidisphaeraceae bacterium]